MSHRIRVLTAAVVRVLRAVAGAPDYERYVEHMRTRHPTAQPLSPRDFAEACWQKRYSRPGARCC